MDRDNGLDKISKPKNMVDFLMEISLFDGLHGIHSIGCRACDEKIS
jgi:hypothetical protein